ncbi:xylulokinase [Frigoribacterium sp. PhB24]|uniref:xylulokinase n=1 Tax=Frigoribacterium sp. PhB24 TaxID=2485204 RepID=UPI000F47A9AE|nr:xylulokinase [Frigoribacterium sp. PhB24]ROS48855.1 xylulokinase [Frigoribacterium sp. PhB24]
MILAHDLGTTGNKATLVDADGRLVDSVTIPYPVDFGPGGRAEQDPEDWWRAVCAATGQLLARPGRHASDVDVVSFSGQMMGAVLVDGRGDPLRPAMIWADTRATRQADALVERVGMERAYALTGHRLNATYTLPKIAWLRDNEPDVFGRASAVVLPKDFVVERLTGVRATDPSDASGTNAYDLVGGQWSDELLAAAGVDRSLLPEIVPSTTVIGTVTTDAARATGLTVGTPVVMGGGDGPMAALGAGIVDADSGAYAYLGSSSWVSVSTDAPVLDPLMRSMTFTHVVPGRFVPTATMQAGGASLQWITNVLAPGQQDRYEQLLAAAEVEAGLDGLFFLPHLLGERSPYWNAHARAAFVGLQMQHERGHLVRAVLEGVAFNLLTGLRAFTEAGVPIVSVDAIGGAAHAELLLRVFADVWGVPISSRDLVDEATSVGAAVVGGVGVGIFDSFDVARTMSRRTARREPDLERATRYAAAHPVFVDAYRRLEPWFEEVAGR